MIGEELGRLAYLVLLAIAVGGYVIVEFRGQFGKALRQIIAWGLIFLGVVAGFGLWTDIRSDLAPMQMTEGERIELPLGNDGHFHLVAQLNDVAVRFIVDTGASGIALSKRDAKRIGIEPDLLAFTGQATTANGVTRVAPVIVKSFRIGEIHDRNVTATVVEGDLRRSLLGMSYLRRFARISFEEDTLVLER